MVKNPSAFDPTNNVDQAGSGATSCSPGWPAQRDQPHRGQARGAQGPRARVSPARNGCVDENGEFFCDYLREYLKQDRALGRTTQERNRLLNTGGLTIETTIDPRFQLAADTSVAATCGHRPSHRRSRDGRPGTGAVRALAQSRPWAATRAGARPPQLRGASGVRRRRRLPGGLDVQGVRALGRDQAGDRPQHAHPVPRYPRGAAGELSTCEGPLRSTDVWKVGNSTGSGTFDLYTGTRQSVNTFFAELETRTGLCDPVTLRAGPDDRGSRARRRGPVHPRGDQHQPALDGSGVRDVRRTGVFCEPRPVERITTSSGKVVADYPDKCRQVLPSAVADAVNDVLRGVQEPGGFGYGAGLSLNKPSAGKTGTIQDNKAVWFMGYTPTLSTAAMLAGANSLGHPISLNNQVVGGSFISRAFGSTQAGPIWGDAMRGVQDLLPDEDFVEPDPTAIEGRAVDVPDVTGMAPDEAALARGSRAWCRPSARSCGRASRAARSRPPRRSPARRSARGLLSRCPSRRAPPGAAGAAVDARPRSRSTDLAAQPSWRRTSAATTPPSARPRTCGWSTPMTCPIALMPSAPRRAMASATSSRNLRVGQRGRQVVRDHGGLCALLGGAVGPAGRLERLGGLPALLALARQHPHDVVVAQLPGGLPGHLGVGERGEDHPQRRRADRVPRLHRGGQVVTQPGLEGAHARHPPSP